MSGIVTAINLDSGKLVGSIDVDSIPQMLIKKRDENRYQSDYNYMIGDIVLGSDNKKYYAGSNNGPSFGGSIDPTRDSTGAWRSYPYKDGEVEGRGKYRIYYDMTIEQSLKGETGASITEFLYPIEMTESPILFQVSITSNQSSDAEYVQADKIDDGTKYSLVGYTRISPSPPVTGAIKFSMTCRGVAKTYPSS